MPINNYSVLKYRATDHFFGPSANYHYQILALADQVQYRIAVDVQSQEYPSELLYFVDTNYQNPITDGLAQLAWGVTPIESVPGGIALDYLRGNLFDVTQMKPLPADAPSHNDLDDLIDSYVQQAIGDQSAVLYAFGQMWGPEENKPDQYFNFLPGRGIHDIHMNQGNTSHWYRDDGPWQDGALLIHFESQNVWVALFLAFQSQCFQTDDAGHCLNGQATTFHSRHH
ncbi:MAG: YukJ family protein [Chloroflexi bacterium]|nr:YukJ family protein [Ktedonobacteraceae bacterium]MBV8822061.1 YukJ family protein [Ktedonobacteraceae bacterium]MBV9019196.1 YukJ family protein [Ktedonobacteraceae bacterium]MBV9706871.1 YukJ family protein [Chloroflexota bacterium]